VTTGDVLVVGYGPVGQVTAILLAQRGWDVTVVERWPRPYPMPRAVSFDGESARILAAAGVAERMTELGEPSRDYVWENGEGQVLFHVDIAERGWSGWPDSTSMYQPGLEAALAERGEALPNLRVLRGHRAVELSDRGDRVEAVVESADDGETRLSARWVVGCDGANSFVRETAGCTVTDHGFFSDWLTCDVVPHDPREFHPNNLQVCDPARPRTAVSAGPGHRRWEFMRVPGESVEEFGGVQSAWRLLGLFGMHPGNATLERHAVYTFQARVVDQWRVGRLLVAGDAAHLMPPFAGQGMCSGFRDAANLAWKLDLVLGGVAGERLLDTYTVERRRHVQHAIGMSMHLGRIICQTDPAAARDRDAAMIAARERGGMASDRPQAAVESLAAGLLRAGAGGAPERPAGDLVPQGRVARDGRLGRFDEVAGTGFVLLATRPPHEVLAERQLAFLDGLGARLVHVVPAGAEPSPATGPSLTVADADRVYLPYLARHGAAGLLVRPDFYAFGSAPDHDGLAGLVDDLRGQLAGVHAG
jgi:flavoprotein hydroxylase